jgi:hypothetical protein
LYFRNGILVAVYLGKHGHGPEQIEKEDDRLNG